MNTVRKGESLPTLENPNGLFEGITSRDPEFTKLTQEQRITLAAADVYAFTTQTMGDREMAEIITLRAVQELLIAADPNVKADYIDSLLRNVIAGTNTHLNQQ